MGFSSFLMECRCCGRFYLLDIVVGFLVAEVLMSENMGFWHNSDNGYEFFFTDDCLLKDVYRFWLRVDYYLR